MEKSSFWWLHHDGQGIVPKRPYFSYMEVSESSKNDPYFQLSEFSWFRTILLIDDFVHELFLVLWTAFFFWNDPNFSPFSREYTTSLFCTPYPPIWIQCKYNVIHFCRILPVTLVNPNFLPSASPLLGLHRHDNPFPLAKAPIFPRNTGRAPPSCRLVYNPLQQ